MHCLSYPATPLPGQFLTLTPAPRLPAPLLLFQDFPSPKGTRERAGSTEYIVVWMDPWACSWACVVVGRWEENPVKYSPHLGQDKQPGCSVVPHHSSDNGRRNDRDAPRDGSPHPRP